MMERESPSAAKQGDKPMELPIKAWLEERGGSKITDHPLEGKKIGEENGGRPFFVQDYFPEENRFTHFFSPLSLSLSSPSSFTSNFANASKKNRFSNFRIIFWWACVVNTDVEAGSLEERIGRFLLFSRYPCPSRV